MTKLFSSVLLIALLASYYLAYSPRAVLAFSCAFNTTDTTKAVEAVRENVLGGYDGPVYAWEITVTYTNDELENDPVILDSDDIGLVNANNAASIPLNVVTGSDAIGYPPVQTADGVTVTYLAYVPTTDPNYLSGNFDVSQYLVVPTGDIEQAGCTGASSPGDPVLTDGTTPPPPPPEPTPVPPCSDETGSNKVSCQKRLDCETDENRQQGKVFARAFNNACVTLPEFIETMVNYVMMFASIIAGFMLLQGGIKIVASRGNPAAVVEARSTLINAGVGLVLLATSYIIIQFLSSAFGYGVSTDINLLGPFIP